MKDNGLDILKSKIKLLRPLLKKGAIDENIVDFLRTNSENLIKFLFVPLFDVRFDEIKRITINKRIKDNENRRIININHLKYPKEEYVKRYGRANYNFQSRLYATFDPITAINEMKPEIGDLITESTWKLKENCYLKVAPIFMITTKDNIVHNEISLRFKIAFENLMTKYSKNESCQYIELLEFVSECFAKDVEYGNSYDYFLSAFFSNKIFNEINNGEVEAIVYPSVQSNLAFSNIVIKPKSFETNYEFKQAEEKIVLSKKPWHLRNNGICKSVETEILKWK